MINTINIKMIYADYFKNNKEKWDLLNIELEKEWHPKNQLLSEVHICIGCLKRYKVYTMFSIDQSICPECRNKIDKKVLK